MYIIPYNTLISITSSMVLHIILTYVYANQQ